MNYAALPETRDQRHPHSLADNGVRSKFLSQVSPVGPNNRMTRRREMLWNALDPLVMAQNYVQMWINARPGTKNLELYVARSELVILLQEMIAFYQIRT